MPDWNSSYLHTYTVISQDMLRDVKPLAQASGEKRGFQVQVKVLDGHFTVSRKLEAQMDVACELPSKDIVLFMDAFDSLFVSDLPHFHIKVKTLAPVGKDFVILSAEKNLWPDDSSIPEKSYPRSASPWRYVNSGVLIGTADLICSILTNHRASLDNGLDDQLFWTQQYLYHNEAGLILLDTGCVLFYNLHDHIESDLLHLHHGRHFLNTVTESLPAILHGNGNGKGPLKNTFLPILMPEQMSHEVQG